MTSWLDTETKALLEGTPPDKLAPPDTAAHTLVLLSIWREDRSRLIRAFERIQLGMDENAVPQTASDLPVALKSGLTRADALLGQVELISCDAVSVFVRDDVAIGAGPEYLRSLYQSLLQSSEFAETSVHIARLPADKQSKSFLDQFLGVSRLKLPTTIPVLRKKARIMCHWGNKIGGIVYVADDVVPSTHLHRRSS